MTETAASNLTPDAFAAWAMKALTLKREAAEAQGRYRALLKKGETELGVDLKAVAAVFNLRNLETPERDTRLRNTLRYMEWLSMPVGSQADLFGEATREKPGDKVAREIVEHFAEELGYSAGKRGDPREANPKPPGSPAAAAWARGWTDGHAIYEAAKADRPEPRKRGRKPGSGGATRALAGPLPLTAEQREAAAAEAERVLGAGEAVAAAREGEAPAIDSAEPAAPPLAGPEGGNVVDFLARARAHLGAAPDDDAPSLAASLPEAEPVDGAAVNVAAWIGGDSRDVNHADMGSDPDGESAAERELRQASEDFGEDPDMRAAELAIASAPPAQRTAAEAAEEAREQAGEEAGEQALASPPVDLEPEGDEAAAVAATRAARGGKRRGR